MYQNLRTALAAIAILSLTFCAVMVASADTVNLSWSRPVTYTNGQAMPVGDLAGYEVECTQFTPLGKAAVACTLGIKQVAGGATLAYAFDVGTVPASGGTYSFVVRSKTTATAVAPNAVSASTSPVQSPSFPAALPSPPSNVQATVQVADTNAYKLRQTVDGFELVAFGTVPAGTVCNAEKGITGGYALIPRASVTPRSRFEPLPLMAFGKCA